MNRTSLYPLAVLSYSLNTAHDATLPSQRTQVSAAYSIILLRRLGSVSMSCLMLCCFGHVRFAVSNPPSAQSRFTDNRTAYQTESCGTYRCYLGANWSRYHFLSLDFVVIAIGIARLFWLLDAFAGKTESYSITSTYLAIESSVLIFDTSGSTVTYILSSCIP
jgi:hypothetical protein